MLLRAVKRTWFLVPLLIVFGTCQPATESYEHQIWRDFLTELRNGDLENPARFRTHYDNLVEPNIRVLNSIRDNAIPNSLDKEPEIHRVGDNIHYLLPIRWKSTPSAEPSIFCFSLVLEEDHWYFQHLENVFIRLDQVGQLPTSQFPDLPEDRKAFMRDEFQVGKDVRLFNYLVEKEGREYALNWFLDGDGYALAAKVWVPFVPPERAFILYLCWDLANLRGEDVTLVELNEQDAVVHWRSPRYFALYMQTGHLRQQIAAEDYAAIFERIWEDRARAGGWELVMEQVEDVIELRFTR